MIAAWMVYANAVGVLLALAASGASRWARGGRSASRWWWIASMIATLALPVWALAWSFARSRNDHGLAIDGVASPVALPAIRVVASRGLARIAELSASVDRVVLIIWMTLTAILVLRLARSMVALARRRSRWTHAMVDALPVLVSPDLGPAVVGLRDPAIVVPAWIDELEPSFRAMVLRHEAEHQSTGDIKLVFAAHALRALVPWNVALWWQSQRLLDAVETDCDQRVIASGVNAERYGSLLLSLAERRRVAPVPVAALHSSPSSLERRIDAMLNHEPARAHVRAMIVAASVLAIVAACDAPTPNAPKKVASQAPATAARVSTTAQSQQAVYEEYQVHRVARLQVGQTAPAYPAAARRAGVDGSVTIRFVIDTTGSAEMSTLEVVKSSAPAFEQAVRDHLPSMRFIPAELGGRLVEQRVSMPFIFSLNK